MIPVPIKTLFRYFEDWKKEGYLISYSSMKKNMREHPAFTEKMIATLSKTLEMPVEEVVMRMQKPWGLMQLMKGEWPDYRLERIRSEIENRLEGALRLFLFLEEVSHKKPEKVKEIIQRLIITVVKKDEE